MHGAVTRLKFLVINNWIIQAIVRVPIPTGKFTRVYPALPRFGFDTTTDPTPHPYNHLPAPTGGWGGGGGGGVWQGERYATASGFIGTQGSRPRGKTEETTSTNVFDSQSVGSWPVLCLSEELRRLKVQGRCFTGCRSIILIIQRNETRLARARCYISWHNRSATG